MTEKTSLFLEPYQIILHPLVTEKGTHLSNTTNSYTFAVFAIKTEQGA